MLKMHKDESQNYLKNTTEMCKKFITKHSIDSILRNCSEENVRESKTEFGKLQHFLFVCFSNEWENILFFIFFNTCN